MINQTNTKESKHLPSNEALARVFKAVSSKSGQYLTYSVALLGMATLIPNLQLPPELSIIASSIGIEALGSLLEKVSSNQLSDDEISDSVEKMVDKLEIKKLLTQDDFFHAFAHLRKGQTTIIQQNHTIFEYISEIAKQDTDLPSKVSQDGIDTSVLRNLLKDSFNDDDFMVFCYDFFPAVYDKFASGMGRAIKIQCLIDYCLRHGQMGKLLELVKEANFYQFNKYQEKLSKDNNNLQHEIATPSITVNRGVVEFKFNIDTKGMPQKRIDEIVYVIKSSLANSLEISNSDINILEINIGSVIAKILLPSKTIQKINNIVQINSDFSRDFNISAYSLLISTLENADLPRGNLSYANLSNTNLRTANLHRARLIKTNLRHADLRESVLVGAYLLGADLRGANLKNAFLWMADLRHALIDEGTQIDLKWRIANKIANNEGLTLDLQNFDMKGVKLFGANLRGIDLSGADFSWTDLRLADFTNANLYRTNLRGALLGNALMKNTNLACANLSLSNLKGADLSGAFFAETDLSEAIYDSNTKWPIELDPAREFEYA